MLIVNADDLGGFPGATDAIMRCFEAGAITSATLMVQMADSARAAGLVRAAGRPAGLHLNLTQPFDGPQVTAVSADRHERICAYFENLRRRRVVPEVRPAMRRLVADEVNDQLEQFETLVGARPTHIDSHHHSHTAGVVMAALPEDLPVRRTASRRGPLIARRLKTTDRFMSFPDLDAAAAAAKAQSVELMVHPSFEEELPILLSDRWVQSVAATTTGSFADLV